MPGRGPAQLWFWQRNRAASEGPAAGPARAPARPLRRFGGLAQEYLTSLDQDEQIHCRPIEWLGLDEWRSGRVVPIGDAARACSPMMGQGGCKAIEDAVVLAELLGSADHGGNALGAYVERRGSRVDWPGSKAVRWARASACRRASAMPPCASAATRCSGIGLDPCGAAVIS